MGPLPRFAPPRPPRPRRDDERILPLINKEYPRRAQCRRQEGIALLYFVMARDGRVLDYRIQESSGHALLDREVERMIERAQPLPEIPPELQQARLELVVPVHFLMR